MTIWTTGIIESEVSAFFFQTRNFIQPQLNLLIPLGDYGSSVEKIRVVFVVNRDDISEYVIFRKKEKILDIRTLIDYDRFRDSSPSHRVQMCIQSLNDAIGSFNKMEKAEFDKQELIRTISRIS